MQKINKSKQDLAKIQELIFYAITELEILIYHLNPALTKTQWKKLELVLNTLKSLIPK